MHNKGIFFWHLKWILFFFVGSIIIYFIIYIQNVYDFDLFNYIWETFFFPYLNSYWQEKILYIWDYFFPIFIIPAIYIYDVNDPEAAKLYKFFIITYGIAIFFCIILLSMPDFLMDFLIYQFRIFLIHYLNSSILQWLDLFWDVFIPFYYIPLILEERPQVDL